MTATLPPNHFRLWTRDTPTGHDLYPGKLGERVPRTQTGTWDRRVVTGPVSADAEALISSWTQDDYSGGFGIKDGNESVDTSRIAFGVIDPRHPKSMCLPPLTSTPTKPAAATGAAYPMGDIGSNFYVGWGNNIYGWNATSGIWHTTANAWPASFVPLNEPVKFGGKMFVPGGAQGTVVLAETNAANGTLSVTALAGVAAVVFGVHDNKLWAIDTANKLWMLTTAGFAAGATTLANWGIFTTAATGTEIRDQFGNAIILDTGVTPTTLLNWFNNAQEPTLWCVTRGQGAFQLDPDEPRWKQATIKPGTHPDWGIDAEVFRDGEDMFICGGGLDLTRLTVNAEVPISGPGKDQGVPTAYQGTIIDLLSERSSLYALIQAGTSVAAGSPTTTWVLQQTVGNHGSATGQFITPEQVAVDSSGKVYVADFYNNRVQTFTSAGVYVASIAVTQPSGVTVDASGNIYVVYNSTSLTKYNSSLVAQWTQTFGTTLWHCATDGTNVYVADASANLIYKRLCSTGAAAVVASWGAAGTGNGEFNSPRGIAFDGTYVYVADYSNNRVQKFNTSGTYQTKWGTVGTGNGELDSPKGVGVDASGDIWVCDFANSRLQRFSNTGTYQTQIAQSFPNGIGVTSTDILWVSSGQHNLAEWDEATVATAAIASKAWLGAWTGTAWCALWESSSAIVPTWMKLSLRSGYYALWWGDTAGQAYYQLLPDPFFNPSARVELGVYPFAATGWMESIRYDANMGGWDKIASHFFAMMQYASASNYVDISYRTDADQWSSGLQDPPYRAWKRVDHIGRTLCRFDDTTVDPISGDTWREGEPFQWIQFRYDFVRGSTTTVSPIWMWHSLHHLSVPQDASSFVLKIPLPQKSGNSKGRAPDEIAETLRGLSTTRKMVHMQTHNQNPDHPEWQVFYRGRVTQVKSEFYLGKDNNLAEVVVVAFIEIKESSNTYTTLAANTP